MGESGDDLGSIVESRPDSKNDTVWISVWCQISDLDVGLESLNPNPDESLEIRRHFGQALGYNLYKRSMSRMSFNQRKRLADEISGRTLRRQRSARRLQKRKVGRDPL